jgi:alpha-tubulin suppressor-like RCC1 family protein
VGDRTSGNTRNEAALVAGLADVVDVSAGYTHSCALRAGGALVCWGSNFYGELGDGTLAQRLDPTPVDWLRGTPVDVEAGHNFTCALRADGTVACWGANVGNVLGEREAVRSRAFPLPVPGVSEVSSLRVAGMHACGLRTTGTVVCWGLVPGRPDALPPRTAMPAEVEGLSDVVEIAVADDHDCARTRGGAVWCWGSNRFGQLGDGTMTDHASPAEVRGLRP